MPEFQEEYKKYLDQKECQACESEKSLKLTGLGYARQDGLWRLGYKCQICGFTGEVGHKSADSKTIILFKKRKLF